MLNKKTKTIFWIVGAIGLVLLLLFLYQLLSSSSGSNAVVILAMLLTGLILGGLIMFLGTRSLKASPPEVRESSHTIAQSMKKVFKIVSAEGHFSEIYNYEETRKLLNFIPTKKKALVIVEAKVLVGYDFEKLKWNFDPEKRTVRLEEFPAPEILSTETEHKYYNIEEQLFNLFSREDLSQIQKNSKAQVIEAARASHLPKAAAEQMQMLLTELLSSKNFILENPSKILEAQNKPLLLSSEDKTNLD